MWDRMKQELIQDTTMEDIAENYRPIVEIIGVEDFIRLAEYAHGDELYIPKAESILAPARNRRIRKEFNGYNATELAGRYNLTTRQMAVILKGEQIPGQLEFDWSTTT